MTQPRRRVFVLGVLGTLGVLAIFLFLSRAEVPRRGPATTPVAQPPPAQRVETGRIPGSDQASPMVTPEPPPPAQRVQLERPLPTHFDAGPRS